MLIYIQSQLNNICSLWSASALLNIEFNSLTLFQRLEAFTLDRREVHEYVLAVFTCDETVALFSVEPLDSSFVHCVTSIKCKKLINVPGKKDSPVITDHRRLTHIISNNQ